MDNAKKSKFKLFSDITSFVSSICTVIGFLIIVFTITPQLQLNNNNYSLIKSNIFCDNQSTIQIAKNDNTSSKTKHISIRYFFHITFYFN